MKVTATRWYPVLIMRDQLGRFAKLRAALVEKRRKAMQSAPPVGPGHRRPARSVRIQWLDTAGDGVSRAPT
jgi:hypothetical protein